MSAWEHYVLIVEDDAQLRDAFRSELRKAGFAAVGTDDATDAVRLAETQKPSAIVIDMLRPLVNGTQLLQLLKSNPATQAIPVVAIDDADHSNVNTDSIACLLQHPVDARALVVAVRHLIAQSAPAEAAAPPTEPAR
jgi:DNA-binding response OmpR family regulator